ncbi:MAG: hypothetical protein EZS28_028239, partial [Streblomastix strix]
IRSEKENQGCMELRMVSRLNICYQSFRGRSSRLGKPEEQFSQDSMDKVTASLPIIVTVSLLRKESLINLDKISSKQSPHHNFQSIALLKKIYTVSNLDFFG